MKSRTPRFRRHALALVVVAAITGSGAAQTKRIGDGAVPIHNGFVTAQAFLEEFSVQQRQAYAMGVIDGMLVAPMLGAPKEKVRWLESCAENMTDTQVAAIIEKFIREHPERWHYGLHVVSWSAMKEACGAK